MNSNSNHSFLEKRGVIEPGRTPPEETEDKEASDKPLEDHVATRAADAVKSIIGKNKS